MVYSNDLLTGRFSRDDLGKTLGALWKKEISLNTFLWVSSFNTGAIKLYEACALHKQPN